MNEWLSSTLFTAANNDFSIGNVLGCVFATIVVLAVLRLSLIALRRYSNSHKIDTRVVRFIHKMVYFGFVLLWLILCMLSLEIDPVIWESLTFRNLFIAGFVIVVARIADKLISSRILEELESHTYQDIYREQYGKSTKSNITRIVQYALILLVVIFLLGHFDIDQSFHFGEDQAVAISISKILTFFLVLLIARLLLWLVINLLLYGWYKSEKIDLGKQYSYNQLLSYVVYFIAVIFALRSMGIDLTLLLAGAAALLVGVGIALQQVISDFFSGLVLLFERTIEVGDFLDLGGYQGTVKKIGLRASIIETLERKDVIIPNSHLVNDRVTNWSSTRTITRFNVAVGVAYGSDTSLTKEVLLNAANETKGVLKIPAPFVRFSDFGNSSLDFVLFFFSDRVMEIEDIKSDIRFRIDNMFREKNITIPFPQTDLWIRSKGDKESEVSNE